MRIVLVLKPYAVEVYTRKEGVYTLISVEQNTQIEHESMSDYEKRMIFVCKDICLEMRSSTYYKQVAKDVKGIDIVLSSPWCTYDVMHVEKDLGKKTKITDAVLKSMFMKKDEKDLHVVESFTSNILLNGYKVHQIQDQYAQTVEFQYVHVYAQESFVSPLMRTMESIFHTHKVCLTSIYGLVEFMSQNRVSEQVSEMEVILEEESIDIAYMYNGMHVVNVFIPYSYIHTEQDIAMKLSTNNTVIQQILISRGEFLQQKDVVNTDAKIFDKNAKNLWPDLDDEVKQIIQHAVDEHMEKVLRYVKDCIDTINPEYTKHTTSLYVYGVNKNIISAYGLELADRIVKDPYIALKMPMRLEIDSVSSIF